MNTRMQALFSDARVQRWLMAGLLLLFVAVSVQYTIKITTSERDNRSAFLRWRNQILALEDGVNIYDAHKYPNPPIMALLLRPLAELPPLVGSLLWFYLKVIMALLVFWLVFRLLDQPDRPFPAWAKALAIALSIRPILGDLTHGNVNIFILFLVVSALYSFRHGKDLSAGLLLALSIACKVTPALFIPYFLWKRAWRTLAGCSAGLVLFLWFVPSLFLGVQYNADLVGGWFDHMVIPYVVEGEVTSEHQNQSLPGLLHRMLTESASFSTFTGMTYVPTEYHNIAAFDPVAVTIILKVCILIFAGLVVWSCRIPRASRLDPRFALEFSLIVLGMLLFSERTWKHHCVTLILPLAAILYFLSTHHFTPRLRRLTIGALAAALLLMAATSTGLYGEALDRAAKLAQVYGAYVWANLILAGIIIVLLRATRTGAAAQETSVIAVRVQQQQRGQWVAVEDVPTAEQERADEPIWTQQGRRVS